VIIINTRIKDFEYGIMFGYVFPPSGPPGAWWNTAGNIISGNDITNNSYGISSASSTNFNNTISGNNVANNTNGISTIIPPFYGTDNYNNTIFDNNIANNTNGLSLFRFSNGIISGNNIAANSNCGINFSSTAPYSSNNMIYHNNFTNNAQEALSGGHPNTWDNGFPSGGNYWSDYRAKYPSASEIDSSGIWNTTGFVKGNYAINAYATPVLDETNATNNNLTGGMVMVTILGDVNGDFFVDISDAAEIGIWWQKVIPPAPANVDINGDDTIDVSDVAIIGINWQKQA